MTTTGTNSELSQWPRLLRERSGRNKVFDGSPIATVRLSNFGPEKVWSIDIATGSAALEMGGERSRRRRRRRDSYLAADSESA